MKEFQKGILDNDRVVTAENVQRMGEVIALCAIKMVIVRGGKDLHNLYKGLLRDINRADDDMSRYSDGYEIAQEAMLFLCQHMGKRLDGIYVSKTGRKITIKQACFSVADRYLAKNFVSPMLNTTSLNEQIMTEPETILDDEQKNDYTAFDGLISKMHLTAVEHETSIWQALQCFKSVEYSTSIERRFGVDKTVFVKNIWLLCNNEPKQLNTYFKTRLKV